MNKACENCLDVGYLVVDVTDIEICNECFVYQKEAYERHDDEQDVGLDRSHRETE